MENHCYALALYFMFYNFVRIHKTLQVTPAMAAKVTNKLLEMSDLVKMIDEFQAKVTNLDTTRFSGKKSVG